MSDELPEDEIPLDDAVIGVAFRRSLLVLTLAALAAAGVWLFWNRRATPTPARELDASAPEAVERTAAPPAATFTDITQEAGIDFVHTNGAYGDKLLPETMGGGVAFFDYDDDGDPDLLFVNGAPWPFHDYGASRPRPTQALYLNDGRGHFTDVTRRAGLDATFYGMGVAVGDYDGDGDRDLFFTALGPNHLFRNDGGRFVDVTAQAGVAGGADAWSTSAGFLDFDGDGDLDLFVCNYVRWSKEIDFELDFRLTGIGRAFGPPQSYEGSFPRLYRNDGDGTFTDVSAEAGVQVVNEATGAPMAKSLALLPVDVDRDGRVDVVVANDTVRNFLFHNQGDGTFAELGEAFGVAYDRNGNATGAMGVDAAYVRDDANLAIAVGNFANEMSSLYVAQDDPKFLVDESIGEGLGAPSRQVLTFGLFFFDYDLDGRMDLLQVNGHIEPEIATVDPSQEYRQPAQLFWNGGAGVGLVPVPAAQLGDLGRPIVGRGAAYADIDGDGDPDVVLTQTGGPPLLLRNDQQLGHHWLRVELAGPPGNRDAAGAWLRATVGAVRREVLVGPVRGYLSQVDPTVLLGLGERATVDLLEVEWPRTGAGAARVERVDVPGVDRTLVVRSP